MHGYRRTVPRSARRGAQQQQTTPVTPAEKAKQAPSPLTFSHQRYAPDFQPASRPSHAQQQLLLANLKHEPTSSQNAFAFSGAPLSTVRWLSISGRQAVAAVGTSDGGSLCDHISLHAVTSEQGSVKSHVVREMPHPGKVLTMTTSANENLLFAGSSDGTVRSLNSDNWEIEDEELQDLARLPKRGGKYEAVTGLAALSRNCVAAVGANGSLCVVDGIAQKPLIEVEQCDPVGFHDAASVDPESGNEIFAASGGGGVSVWDTRTVAQTRACEMSLKNPIDGSVACCVTADAMQPHFVLAGMRDGELSIWDRRGTDDMPLSRVVLHSGPMWDLGVVTSSKPGLLLCCGEDGKVGLMDFAAAAARGGIGSAAEAWCDSGEFWRATINPSDVRLVAQQSDLGVNSVSAHSRADMFAYASDSGLVGFGSLYSS